MLKLILDSILPLRLVNIAQIIIAKRAFSRELKHFKITKKFNVKPSEACFSWLLNHSQLKERDAIILGASSVEQLMEKLQDSRGVQLNADMLQTLEDLWKAVESEAPKYYM
jgi:aryl-alcohol dehydrogenase-like predicted oxidoreductase